MSSLKRGLQWRPSGAKNFVHARDVARGIHSALKVGRKGQCYLLGGENLTYHEFFSQLNLVTGNKRRLIVLPKGIVHAAGTIADTWSKLTHQTFPFNKANAHLLTQDNYYSSERPGLNSILKSLRYGMDWSSLKKENYITTDYYSTHGTSFDR